MSDVSGVRMGPLFYPLHDDARMPPLADIVAAGRRMADGVSQAIRSKSAAMAEAPLVFVPDPNVDWAALCQTADIAAQARAPYPSPEHPICDCDAPTLHDLDREVANMVVASLENRVRELESYSHGMAVEHDRITADNTRLRAELRIMHDALGQRPVPPPAKSHAAQNPFRNFNHDHRRVGQ